MGQFYNIALDGDTLTVGFVGASATNDVIVKDVAATLAAMKANGVLAGGPLLKINGPASLPIAVVIAHAVTHLYGAVAVYDPKLLKYVVSVSHSPDYAVGDLI
jgi:CRISPR-associated protein Csx3